MTSESFEDAFFQLDTDRDGVVTEKDLRRYCEEKGLKESFVQKWMNLFSDNNKIIYYENFCKTLGIVPAPEKFSSHIYKVDMSPNTQKSVIDIVRQTKEKYNSLSERSLNEIKRTLEKVHGDNWKVLLNPNPSELDVEYAEDGILYYSPDSSESTKLLVWRDTDKPFESHVYKVDMSPNTQKSVMDIVLETRDKHNALSEISLNEIKRTIEENHGDNWNVVLNPNPLELDVEYAKDGILYYSPDSSESTKLLVWRDTEKPHKDTIFEIDMTDSVKEGVIDCVHKNFDPDHYKDLKIENIIKELDDAYGKSWKAVINPTKGQLKPDYDFDGKLYFSPDSDPNTKLLIWRQDCNKRHGNMCCCGLF